MGPPIPELVSVRNDNGGQVNRREALLASFAVVVAGAPLLAVAQDARKVHHIATLGFGASGANLSGPRPTDK